MNRRNSFGCLFVALLVLALGAIYFYGFSEREDRDVPTPPLTSPGSVVIEAPPGAPPPAADP